MRTTGLLRAVLFITTGCVASVGIPASACAQSDSDVRCGCLIVGLQGKAKITPENSSQLVPAAINMSVFTGDLVHVDPSSLVNLICGEANTVHPLTAGHHGVPCGVGDRGPAIWIGGRAFDPGGTRGTEPIPMLLSPRKTTLLSAHPKIRWTSVANVIKYTVRVTGPNVDWSARVESTEIVYPDNAPALVGGQSYKIRILAGRRTSDDENVPGLDFTIIADTEGARVKAREAEINGLNVEETSKRLVIASLYARNNLNAEAIMRLDDGSNDPETVRLLADLYLNVLLNDKAEEQYRRLLQLAGANTLAKAGANDRLGQIYEASRIKEKKDKAIQKYEDALSLYMDLKNWEMVSKLATKLGSLQKR